MNVRDKLKKLLIKQGWKTDGDDHFETQFRFGYDSVSLTLGKKVDFYGRCYPTKEGWEISKRSYSSVIKEINR